jgi:hypothetical protein
VRASRTLPAGFALGGTVTLAGNRRLLMRLALLSIPWTAASFLGCILLTTLVRPEGWQFSLQDVSLSQFMVVLVGGWVGVLIVTIVLHEAAHGLVLWLLTRSRPVFGFRGWYFYADAPGWYLSRGQMLTVLAAPLILLTVMGLPLIAFAPAGLSLFVTFGLVVNAGAAIGDLYMIVLVVRIRGPVIFGDAPNAEPGEAGSWFVPAEAGLSA